MRAGDAARRGGEVLVEHRLPPASPARARASAAPAATGWKLASRRPSVPDLGLAAAPCRSSRQRSCAARRYRRISTACSTRPGRPPPPAEPSRRLDHGAHAQVDARGEAAVETHLLAAERGARRRAVVEEAEADRLLELVGEVAGEEDARGMRVDHDHILGRVRIEGRVRQRGSYARVGVRGLRPAASRRGARGGRSGGCGVHRRARPPTRDGAGTRRGPARHRRPRSPRQDGLRRRFDPGTALRRGRRAA